MPGTQTVEEFLSYLHAKGAGVWLKADGRMGRGAIQRYTSEDQNEMILRRDEILACLQGGWTPEVGEATEAAATEATTAEAGQEAALPTPPVPAAPPTPPVFPLRPGFLLPVPGERTYEQWLEAGGPDLFLTFDLSLFNPGAFIPALLTCNRERYEAAERVHEAWRDGASDPPLLLSPTILPCEPPVPLSPLEYEALCNVVAAGIIEEALEVSHNAGGIYGDTGALVWGEDSDGWPVLLRPALGASKRTLRQMLLALQVKRALGGKIELGGWHAEQRLRARENRERRDAERAGAGSGGGGAGPGAQGGRAVGEDAPQAKPARQRHDAASDPAPAPHLPRPQGKQSSLPGTPPPQPFGDRS